VEGCGVVGEQREGSGTHTHTHLRARSRNGKPETPSLFIKQLLRIKHNHLFKHVERYFLFFTRLFNRNIAFGLASAGGRMGSLASPYSTYFVSINSQLPYVK